MRAKAASLALVLVLGLEMAACSDLSRLVDVGTPSPTEAINREVVRLDATRSPSPTPPDIESLRTPVQTPSRSPLIGKQAVIVGTQGNGLNGRAGPSVNQDVKATFAEGSAVRVMEGPVEADGFTWWRVQSDAGFAWVASKWLQFESGASPTAKAGTPAPADWREVR